MKKEHHISEGIHRTHELLHTYRYLYQCSYYIYDLSVTPD